MENIKYINKSIHNFINTLPPATCFGFVSHLETEYTIVVWTTQVYYKVISDFDEISSEGGLIAETRRLR